MKFSDWIVLREANGGVTGPDLIKWGDTNALLSLIKKNKEANPHYQEPGKGPIKMAPPASEKKPVPPPVPVPKKKMKK